MVGKSTGIVLMAPPSDNAAAQASIATLLSALKPKQKVGGTPCSSDCLALVCCLCRKSPSLPLPSPLWAEVVAQVVCTR